MCQAGEKKKRDEERMRERKHGVHIFHIIHTDRQTHSDTERQKSRRTDKQTKRGDWGEGQKFTEDKRRQE